MAQTIQSDGFKPTFVSADSGGNEFFNDKRTFIVIRNNSTGDRTATFAVKRANFAMVQQGFGSLEFGDLAVSIPAGEERWVRVPPSPYNDTNGKVQVQMDDASSVEIGAFRISPN